MPYFPGNPRCSESRYRAACKARRQLEQAPCERRRLVIETPWGRRYARTVEIAAMREGREAWLAGYEEPDSYACMELDLQSLYEDAYYTEIRDAVNAVVALSSEDKRRVPR